MAQVIVPSNLGPEFDIGNIQVGKIRLKLGSGLAIQPDGTIVANVTTNTIQVDTGYLASATIPVQDVNDNGAVILSNVRADTGWSFTGDVYTYTGSPNRVRIDAQIHQQDPGGLSRARANPTLTLQRNTGSGWLDVAESATGYIRDASGHIESSNTISFTDPTPGTNPQYRLQSSQESSNGQPVNSRIGHFSLEAKELITVLIP